MHNFTTEYLAGFFDGEGCVTVTSRGPSRSGMPCVHATIAQIDPTILRAFHARWGGSLAFRKAQKQGQRRYWTWCIASRKAEAFLVELMPLLHTKHAAAEAAVSYIRTANRRGEHFTPETRAARESALDNLVQVCQTARTTEYPPDEGKVIVSTQT